MKLNLKKVISSIAALAISAGVLVAPVSASKFDDVADTAAYKQAVEELASLGIVQGDAETGLFRPEDNIARSEVTKLVVAAMGPAYMEAAAGATGVDTEFSDVPGSHWASGYISTGVANKFINGMGDGTFAPDANVTYAQVVKMVVAAMGYTTICEKNGGWPNGYLTTAANIGITSGLNIVGADTVVTRGQVAMLLDNAIKTPIVAIGSYDENYADGSLSANLKVMDDITAAGNAEDYRTLLTENHSAYSVKGRITSTKKSNPKLDNGEVTFNIESAKNFDGRAYGATYNKPEEITVLYDGTDAEALLFSYAEALIQLDEDENWVLLSVTPTGSNKAVEVPANLLDAGTVADFDKDNAELDFYQAADSNKVDTYEFATKTTTNEEGSETTLIATEMYVNGVKYKKFSEDPKAAIAKFIQNNPSGTVTLIDQTEAGKTTTDGKIDFILVDYYVDAVVSSVVEGDVYRIYLKDANPVITKGSIKVDTEDEDITASYELDGMEVEYTELAEGDVLSIAYDVTDTFDKSAFYNVLVSRNTVTGLVQRTKKDVNDKTLYEIDGELYTKAADSVADLTPGEAYVLYLNVFGQYVSFEEDASSANIGILDAANITTADELTVTIIDTAGNKTTYDVKDSLRSEIETKVNAFYTTLESGTNPYKWSNRKDLANRVVKYSVSGEGYLTGIETVAVQNFTAADAKKEYKANFSKIGSYALAENTAVIDLSANSNVAANGKATKIGAKTVADLKDGVSYGGIVVDKSSVSGEYRLFIITSGEEAYTADTAIAVFQGYGTEYDDAYGRNVVVVEAYKNGVYADEAEETGDIIKTAFTVAQLEAKNLVPGSVFLYQTNSDGYADVIDVIYDGPEADYADFITGVAGLTTTTSANGKTVWSNTAIPAQWDATTDATKSGNVEILFGAVSAVKGSNVSVAQIADFTIGENTVTGYDIEAAEDFNIASDANVYVYDYSVAKAANRLYIGGNVLATNAGYKVAGAGSDTKNIVPVYYEDGAEQTINFIFAKVVDDVITECLVILGK